MIKEDLLSFIWEYKYYNFNDLKTIEGKSLKVLKVGTKNDNQGPDFLHAQILIDNIEWVGNIEIDLKRSFWKSHKHDSNTFYQNVILHVVWENDTHSLQTGFPVLELKPYIPKYFLEQFAELMRSQKPLACSHACQKVQELTWLSWKERMFVERMEHKTKVLQGYLQATQNHWEQTFFIALMRNFGLVVNAQVFEDIAKTIPIEVFSKIKSSLFQIEAILFGQANLLQENFKDEYPKKLQKEYQYLKHKFDLQTPEVQVSFSKMFPHAFPTIRLAQMAHLIFKSHGLFSKILQIENIHEFANLFDLSVSEYWHTHFRFDKESSIQSSKKRGQVFMQSLMNNTLLPVLFLYGQTKDLEDIKERVLTFYQQLPPEENKIMRIWEEHKIPNVNAFDSQSLYHLYKHYCSEKKCLHCSIAHAILRMS